MTKRAFIRVPFFVAYSFYAGLFLTFESMKRTLILIRHAKSSWSEEGISDLDRPLNNRGERDAPFMAKRMAESDHQVDAIVTSPAKRAKTTALAYKNELQLPDDRFIEAEVVYEADVKDLMNLINSFDDQWKCVILFGHNPGFSYLIQYLSGSMLHMPTNGVGTLEMEIDSWEHAGTSCATLVDFDFPKKHLPPL